MQTHDGSALDNPVTLTSDLLTSVSSHSNDLPWCIMCMHSLVLRAEATVPSGVTGMCEGGVTKLGLNQGPIYRGGWSALTPAPTKNFWTFPVNVDLSSLEELLRRRPVA